MEQTLLVPDPDPLGSFLLVWYTCPPAAAGDVATAHAGHTTWFSGDLPLFD